MQRAVSWMAAAAVCWGLVGTAGAARRTRYHFLATAFSAEGITAAGVVTNVGIVAADPDVLPLGTRIRVTGAGRYSGTYLVADTGEKVDGKHIDIYLPNHAAALKFGKRMVRVRVLKWGHGKKSAAKAETTYPQAFGPGVRTTPSTSGHNSR